MQSYHQQNTTYQAPAAGSKIIIVGGGCFGLSTAHSLALNKDKNYDIWVYDREEIPVRDAASNGKENKFGVKYFYVSTKYLL